MAALHRDIRRIQPGKGPLGLMVLFWWKRLGGDHLMDISVQHHSFWFYVIAFFAIILAR